MNKYKYKEKTYAEDIVNKGFVTNNVNFELRILAKYYKELGHKPKEREELIYKFCEDNLDGYNRVTHFKMINNALNYGRKKDNKLIEIDEIHITKSELATIDNIELDHEHKKVAFTLLVLDKLNKKVQEIKYGEQVNNEHYFGGEEKYYRELKRLSKIPLHRRKDTKNIQDLIKDLSELDIVQPTTRGMIKLSFIYDIPKDNEVVLTMNRYDNIGYYYDYYVGRNKVKPCEKCDSLITGKNNKTKYCSDCAKFKKNEQNKGYYHLGK